MNGHETELLAVEEFAARLQVSRATVFTWIGRGILKPGRHFFRLGRVLRFPWSQMAIQALLEDSVVVAEGDLMDSHPPCSSSTREKLKSPINWEN